MDNTRLIHVLGENAADVPKVVEALKLGFNALKLHRAEANIVYHDNHTKFFEGTEGDIRIDVTIVK